MHVDGSSISNVYVSPAIARSIVSPVSVYTHLRGGEKGEPDASGVRTKPAQLQRTQLRLVWVRVNIIGHARIIYVGKSQSCMV